MLKKNTLVLFLLTILPLAVLPTNVSASSTTIQVDPSISIIKTGETFKVNIIVTDVTNLTCWEFILYYKNSVLNCTAITQGPFLRTGGGTFFARNITNAYNATHGRVLAGCTLFGLTSVSGSGTLATITFQAKATGHTTLHLEETVLGDENIPPEDIPHSTKDGTVHVTAELWYIKSPYPDCAPSGMPDFDQRQNGTYNWTDPGGKWSHCGPVAVANSLWWFDSKYESFNNPNPVPPPAISDNFPLVQAYGAWDDHDPQNVQPLVEHLAWLMDCDAQRTGPFTGVFWSGTYVNHTHGMEAGLAQYLSWSGVNPLGDVNGDAVVNQTDVNLINDAMGTTPGSANWNLAADIFPTTTSHPPTTDNIIDNSDLSLVTANLGKTGTFYEHTKHALCRTDFFYYIEEEVEKSQDVVLLLGIYHNGIREYGHYVTVAGVNSTTMELLISNPIRDDFEAGKTPGRSPAPHQHQSPEPPYTTHNNASLVSQDAYTVAFIPGHPSDYHWQLDGYIAESNWTAMIEYAVITSPKPVKPDLEIIPPETTCRKYCENFTVQINVTHAVDVHDFHFKIMYNTTLLDYVSVDWGQLGPGTITVYETLGLLEGQIVPTDPWMVVNGNQTLLNITFHAAYYHVWKDMTACPDWMNDLHGKIWFHWAQLTYLEGEPLTYEEDGPLKEIDVFDAWYTFMPIQGDINNDGSVSILDISLAAGYYEQAYLVYDLNCDGIVDIFDLVIIAANLWFEHEC